MVHAPPSVWGRGASTLLADPKASPPPPGRPHTAESRAKISAANKGKTPWNKGLGHSEETKARIRERTKQAMEKKKREKLAEMGMTLEEFEEMKARQKEEERAKRREAKRNATMSEDYKAKLSARMRERWQNPEYREKALKHLNESRALQTEETRKKISETMKRVWEQDRYPRNRTIAEETRKKISEKLKEMYANPEYKVKLSQSRRRDPEHNRKISEAIRRKWAGDESYKNKTLSGIQSYQEQYAEATASGDPARMPRRRSNTTASGTRTRKSSTGASPSRRTTAAKRKALLREELQELERLDREMRGEIRARKGSALVGGVGGGARRKKSRASEMAARQAQDVWDQIYGQVSPEELPLSDGEAAGELLQVIVTAPGDAAAAAAAARIGEEGVLAAAASEPAAAVLRGGEAAAGSLGSLGPDEPGASAFASGAADAGDAGEASFLTASEAGAVDGADGAAPSLASPLLEEADRDWRAYMERVAKADAEDEELKRQRKAAQKRFLEEVVPTDVFQLVDGKVAVNPVDAPPPAEAAAQAAQAAAEAAAAAAAAAAASAAEGPATEDVGSLVDRGDPLTSFPPPGFPLEGYPVDGAGGGGGSSSSSSSSSSAKAMVGAK